jgi:hypothetical protein
MVERAKDNSFLFMVVELTSVMLNDLDFVSAMSLISTGMEISCIFIPFNSCLNFASLFPKLQFSLGDSAENADD